MVLKISIRPSASVVQASGVTWREGAALVNRVDYWVAASHWTLGSKKSLSLRKRYPNSPAQIQWKLNPWEYVLQVPVWFSSRLLSAFGLGRASLTPTHRWCYHSITKAGEVLSERHCINSLLFPKEAVTSKYFSLGFVSQSDFLQVQIQI